MRRPLLLTAVFCALVTLGTHRVLAQAAAPAATPTPGPAPALVRLTADHMEFYYDQFLIEADGHVRVEASDGLVATGDAFSMDLKLNRYLLAGHVTLTTTSGTVHGAAIADFLDFSRIYFVPVTTEPDRWTFLNGDLQHPAKGRIMPGDAFSFPQVGPQPSLTASSAVVGTRDYVRFSGATGNLGGLPIPLGSYVVNFSSNQYFAQNSLTGANFDTTWNFAGGPNALSALHFRYDTVNYFYLAFEQHLVGDHEYAIFSVNPISRAGKFYNFQLYDRLGSRFQIQDFTQLYVYQYNLSAPQAATQTSYINATYALPHSYLTAASNLTNYNILGINPLLQQTFFPNSVKVGAGNLSHPSYLQIGWSSFQNRIGGSGSPFYEQIYGAYGFNHDSVGANQYLQGCTVPKCGLGGIYALPLQVPGLQAYGAACNYKFQPKPPIYFCPVYTTIYDQVLGFTLFATSIKLGDQDNPYKTFFLNASLNEQEQWNSLPHRIRQTIAQASLSRQFARQVNSYLSYAIQNTGDYYLRGGYTTCSPTINGQPNPACPPGLDSFRGVATWHTLSLGVNYVPSPEFNFSILARHHADFPPPVPNLYAQPPLNVLGQPLYATYLGQPPNDLSGDVRFKLLPHMMVDVSRTYFFHYGNLTWSPQTVIQVLPI
ncbi:MAG: hypothetical protein JOY98_09245 [Candidatus Eremiobacteraeota bacterium]|nr:hypothetical protein [Candidatus Eremiobacteraeota bacterium]